MAEMRGSGVAGKVRRTGRLMRMARTVSRGPRTVLRLRLMLMVWFVIGLMLIVWFMIGLVLVVWFVIGLMLLLRGALRRLIVG